jgi:hypothetical protein
MIWFETTTKIDGSTGTGFMVVLVSLLPKIIYGVGGGVVIIGAITSALVFWKWKMQKNHSKRFI